MTGDRVSGVGFIVKGLGLKLWGFGRRVLGHIM